MMASLRKNIDSINVDIDKLNETISIVENDRDGFSEITNDELSARKLIIKKFRTQINQILQELDTQNKRQRSRMVERDVSFT